MSLDASLQNKDKLFSYSSMRKTRKINIVDSMHIVAGTNKVRMMSREDCMVRFYKFKCDTDIKKRIRFLTEVPCLHAWYLAHVTLLSIQNTERVSL